VNISNLQYWVLAQLGLEIVLVLLLGFFLIKMRSMSTLLKDSQEEEKLAAANLEKLSQRLTLLESKRASLEETLGLLTEQAQALKEQNSPGRHAAQDSYNSFSPKPNGGSLRRQVEDLHLQGFSPGEISQRLGMHPTEVKMALELGRLKAK
jgi:chromosome segregation ATPase